MKKTSKLFLGTFLTFVLLLSGCGDKIIEINGEVKTLNYMGYTCWYVVDKPTGFYYEILTPDDFLLRRGLQVRIKAKTSNKDTICKVGEKIDVISYRIYEEPDEPMKNPLR